ncbi:diaminopimelate dehydrogenase [Fusobacterium sp. PH5-44]|uniref:diaminopimelate dehydrogenase n=1 Tax=unclassified Fusobacterium TaxID=2648384 RepID=UPI003D24A4D3
MIKLGIYGYGNLGKGVECAIKQNNDIELVAVFTRREPHSVNILHKDVKVHSVDDVLNFKDKIDVLILCGGSATDLPTQSPMLAKDFNIIDSYDTHAKVNEHFSAVNKSSMAGKTLSIICVGWDPGMFSVNRLYNNAILPDGADYTFWGKGVSQGHSDAIRRINGVKDARQYTIPIDSALEAVRKGLNPKLSTREKHLRECYVVLDEGADIFLVEKEIKEMPNYFAEYETIVNFISQEELDTNHSGMPHGGFVIRSGNTGWDNQSKNIIEYSLKLDSNPQFTASVLVAYARAAYKMHQEGQFGCKTIFDIAPGYLSNLSPEELRKKLL